MNKAASKCLCSFLADIKVILTTVDGCWNLSKAARKKDYFVSTFCARPHREMTRRSIALCYWRSGTSFQVEFSLMYSLQLARIEMFLRERLDCWNTRVADAYLHFHIITHSRERPAAWIFKNVCLSFINIHTNWYCPSEVAEPFRRCTLSFSNYSLPFYATKCGLI